MISCVDRLKASPELNVEWAGVDRRVALKRLVELVRVDRRFALRRSETSTIYSMTTIPQGPTVLQSTNLATC